MNFISHFLVFFMNESPPPTQTLETQQKQTLLQDWRALRAAKMKDLCRLALPSGSLQEATITKLNEAGYAITFPGRSLSARSATDPEIVINLYRSMEIPSIVAQGYADIGITGDDILMEKQLEWLAMEVDRVIGVANFKYAKNGNESLSVLAVQEDSPFRSVSDLRGGRIDSEVPFLTKRYCDGLGIATRVASSFERGKILNDGRDFITITPSQGATEGKTNVIADGIVTVSESGVSIVDNNLRVIGTIWRNRVGLILNRESRKRGWGRKAKEIAIKLLDDAKVEGSLNDEFDRDSRKLC